MKKILLAFVIVFWVSFSIHAQNITIDNASYDLTINSSEIAEALSNVTNNSASQMTIKWVRYVDSQPTGWDFAICDKNNCYTSALKSNTFTLDKGASGLMKMDVSPSGIIGEGSYHINIFDVNDSAGSHLTMTVHVTSEANTGISNVNDEVISIYPNPVKDELFINLDATKHITSVEIYNVVGQKMKTVNLQEGLKSVSIQVSDMKKGIYFLRVISGGSEITTRTFSKD